VYVRTLKGKWLELSTPNGLHKTSAYTDDEVKGQGRVVTSVGLLLIGLLKFSCSLAVYVSVVLMQAIFTTQSDKNNNSNNNRSSQSHLGREWTRPLRVLAVQFPSQSPSWLQWDAPTSPPKLSLPLSQHIQSAVFPQFTHQTDAHTDRQMG